jgi:hypothetical protein
VAALTLPDLVEEERFWPVLVKTLECFTKELDAAKGPERCYTGFMIGDAAGPLGLATDCKSGVAWVRPIQAFPSTDGSQPADTTVRCGVPDAMAIEIGIARYAPRAQGRNMQPDPQEMFNATRLYLSDFAVMRKTICCMQEAYKHSLDISRGVWDPIPVGAGLGGGAWTFTVG